MTESEIIDSDLSSTKERRRKLLPVWIKIFLWIFMVFGAIVPVGLILGAIGLDFNLALYGLETTNTLSITGLLIILFLAIKGTVSFGLWTEKDWAVNLAIIDAIIGIVTCSIVMLVLPFLSDNNGVNFDIRLELIALTPYLIKMRKIKGDWYNRK
ncbi:hypothetical protein [Tenacibaculum sp. C7A-26P2]|uniref:hypothetical protein n=1 Tax=Tenacibaculum sp. C7A-26P2 TaxID=3447504 RepID=UPI003F86C403